MVVNKESTNEEEKKEAERILCYMKEVASITSLVTDDGQKLLSEQMKKMNIEEVDRNSAFSTYLNLSSVISNRNPIKPLIFPFGCNQSQYKAVENALYHNISVIEGPPGTGKTQTILNIIANILIRNGNCQVVSNNNTAILNIYTKLKNYDMDFFVALLGNKKNKEHFIEEQESTVPKFLDEEETHFDNISYALENCEEAIKNYYDAKNEIAILRQRKRELELEYAYFKKLVKMQELQILPIKKYDSIKTKLLWNEMLSVDKINFFHKVKFVFKYNIIPFRFFKYPLQHLLKSLENQIYIHDMETLTKQMKEKEAIINKYQRKEEEFIHLSMLYFKKYLSLKFKKEKKKYTLSDIWKQSHLFLKDYPVVLSTTYSSRNIFRGNGKFDYLIMDEASQIDVATGTLALSSAKYAVIIGDEMQLPNVVSHTMASETDKIFNKYHLVKSYSYSLHSFLSSIKNTIPQVPIKMLVEHYRCHPKIIDFCNKKFYENKLVIMTNDQKEENVIKVIKTNKGNHAREHTSQRQVDIIKEIISKEKEKDIGIITPFNKQVDLVKENIEDMEVSTVHKFQGREKDTIIISTVEDDISDFVGDPKILNVALSRAKKHLYFIVTGNEIKNSHINDFIDYVEYNNLEIENSKIYSSFDLLYKQYELERLEFFKKHNRILKYDSENIIYYLIKKIIEDYKNLEFHFHQSLNDIIRDKSLLTEEEKKYAMHPNTHFDFYIFKKLGNKPVLVIEVDGYYVHKKGTRQYERDLLKNSILEKYEIPYIRLKTNGSNEEKRIRNKLEEILK